jgi:hypothetical protein
MKPKPIYFEKRAAVLIWLGTAVFLIGAMFFGH